MGKTPFLIASTLIAIILFGGCQGEEDHFNNSTTPTTRTGTSQGSRDTPLDLGAAPIIGVSGTVAGLDSSYYRIGLDGSNWYTILVHEYDNATASLDIRLYTDHFNTLTCTGHEVVIGEYGDVCDTLKSDGSAQPLTEIFVEVRNNGWEGVNFKLHGDIGGNVDAPTFY